MPSFQWNLLMCFFMGLDTGGMLPITYALLAECMPTKARGWTVLVGAFGLIGGWFAASGFAALLEPTFGWRIIWFLNAPTGVILILCNHFIPESPRFLLAHGRIAEALVLLQRFAVQLDPRLWGDAGGPQEIAVDSSAALLRSRFRATTATLNLAPGAWGLVNFGLLLWLPADLRARGYGVARSNELLFYSSLLALPTTMMDAWFYSQCSTKWTLVTLSILTAIGLVGLPLIDSGIPFFSRNLLVLLSVPPQWWRATAGRRATGGAG
jgi:putative MFS transporter